MAIVTAQVNKAVSRRISLQTFLIQIGLVTPHGGSFLIADALSVMPVRQMPLHQPLTADVFGSEGEPRRAWQLRRGGRRLRLHHPHGLTAHVRQGRAGDDSPSSEACFTLCRATHGVSPNQWSSPQQNPRQCRSG